MLDRRAFLALALCGSILMTVGCGGGDEEEDNSKVIALTVMTMKNPFFKEIADAMTEEAKKHGYKVWVEDGDSNPTKQQEQIKNFIDRKVAAIVIVPTKAEAIGTSVVLANEAKIPVFSVDTAIVTDGKVVSHIATDNYLGGQLAGEAMIEALGENGGEVLILDHKDASSCVKRVDGFKNVINSYNKGTPHGKIVIVEELPSGGEHETSYNSTIDALQAHKDIVGIFAINDPGALGAYAALDKTKKTASVKIIGFDGQRSGKEAIRDGKIYADPIQFPGRMGRMAVEVIVKHWSGEKVEAEYPIRPELYRKADALKDPDLK